jgi:hypothetical protein
MKNHCGGFFMPFIADCEAPFCFPKREAFPLPLSRKTPSRREGVFFLMLPEATGGANIAH